MRYWERWQVAQAAFGEAGQALGDIVGSWFDEDDKTIGEYMSLAGRGLKGFTYGVGNTAMGVVGTTTDPIIEASELVGNAVHQVGATYATAANLTNSPSWIKEQGYQSDDSFVGLTAKNKAMFDPVTWGKAWDLAKTTSIGQATWRGFKWDGKQVDITDPDAVAKLQDDPLFNVASGFTDALISWYADPVEKGAKVVTAARKVGNVYQAGSHATDPWLERMLFKHTKIGEKDIDPTSMAFNSDRVDEFIAWAAGKSARDIMRHPMIAKSSRRDDFAGVIAGLLDRSDHETARHTIAAAFGSTISYNKIQELDRNLAGRIVNVRESSNLLLERELQDRKTFGLIDGSGFQGFKGQKVEKKIDALDQTDAKYHEHLRDLLLENDQNQKNIYNAILGEDLGESGLLYSATMQVPKKSHSRIADRHIAYESGDVKEFLNSSNYPQAVQHIIQPKPFGTPIRMIAHFPIKAAQSFTNKRPPSWIDPARSDGASGFASYLQHAKVFDETRIGQLTNEYINALSVQDRRKVIDQAEAQAVVRIARKHGLPGNFAELLAKAAQTKRNNAISQLKTSPSGKAYFLDEDGNIVRWPLFETQEVNAFPLLDLDEFNLQMGKEAGGLKGALFYSPAAFLDQAYTSFSGVWSAMQLLRVGYGIRNVTEGALRLNATLGASWIALAAADGYRAGIGANAAVRTKNVGKRIARRANNVVDVTSVAGNRLIQKSGATPPSPNFTTLQDLTDRYLGRVDQLSRDLGKVRTQSALGIEYDGVSHRGPYYGKAEGYQVLAGSSFENIASARDEFLKTFRKSFDSSEIINPTDRGHLEEWTHIAKNVIGKSEIAKRFFAGDTYDEVLEWLTKDHKGMNVLRKVGGDKTDARQIVGEAMAVVDTYVPLVPGADPLILRRMAAEGTLAPKDLEDWFPNQATRPQVWGAQIQMNLRDGQAYRAMEWVTSRGFKYIASMPEDKLIRNPAFRQMYIGHIRQLRHNFESQNRNSNITNLDVERIDHAAREKALQQLKRTLYDGTTKSNAAHRFRMVMGFMSAWEDSITKWGRIIVEDPSVLVQGAKLWNAPNEMSLGSTWDPDALDEETGIRGAFVPRFNVVREVKDKDGNGTGAYEDAPVNYDIFSMNEEASIEIRLPAGIAKLIPGARDDVWTISKPSANLVAQGDTWWLPSAGPLTQISLSELVYANPVALKDVRDWALPYGPTTRNGVLKALMPATYKRIYETGQSITDDSYGFAYLNNLQTEIMNMKLGKRNYLPRHELLKEVKDRTDKFFYLRAAANFILPFAVENKSPYQYYIDKYQQLRTQYAGKRDGYGKPVDIDEMFRQRYGDDFYMFAASMSKNNTGLPASARAYELSEKNRDLIAKDPEMARIYLSDVDDATFDQHVYAAQFKQTFSDTNPMTAREKQPPEEALKDNNRKLGWLQYTRVNDFIMGLEDEPDADLGFLDFFRSEMAKEIAQSNPDFAEDYLVSDPEKVPNRILKMQQLASDKSINSRPEIRQLNRYLIAREQFLQELNRRDAEGGAKTLKGRENRDLAKAWKDKQLELARGNTLFGNIYWRYLSNDRLQVSRLAE